MLAKASRPVSMGPALRLFRQPISFPFDAKSVRGTLQPSGRCVPAFALEEMTLDGAQGVYA